MSTCEKVGLSAALARIGDDNTTFQRLDTDASRIDFGKREARITFATDNDVARRLVDGTLTGLVVWVDAEALRQAVFGKDADHG